MHGITWFITLVGENHDITINIMTSQLTFTKLPFVTLVTIGIEMKVHGNYNSFVCFLFDIIIKQPIDSFDELSLSLSLKSTVVRKIQ